jgi:hypothetical protein
MHPSVRLALWNGHPHFPACVTLDVDSGQKGMNDNANSRIGRTGNSGPFHCVVEFRQDGLCCAACFPSERLYPSICVGTDYVDFR